MNIRKDICNKCPFSRSSAPGYLGRNNAEDFVELALSDDSVHCHSLIDYDNDDDYQRKEAIAPRCRGAITLMRNTCKLPRSRESADAVRAVPQDHDAVFSNKMEFLRHHKANAICENIRKAARQI